MIWFPKKPYPISDHNGQNLLPFSDQHDSKTIPFGDGDLDNEELTNVDFRCFLRDLGLKACPHSQIFCD